MPYKPPIPPITRNQIAELRRRRHAEIARGEINYANSSCGHLETSNHAVWAVFCSLDEHVRLAALAAQGRYWVDGTPGEKDWQRTLKQAIFGDRPWMMGYLMGLRLANDNIPDRRLKKLRRRRADTKPRRQMERISISLHRVANEW